MIRKLSATFAVAAMLVVAAPALSASAATISNGKPCTKSGATTKVSGFKYVCAKNPLVKNSKLTWLSTDCVATAKDYVTKSASAKNIGATTTEALRVIDEAIATANAEKPDLQARIDSETARIAIIKAKIANTTDAGAIATYNKAIKARESYIKAYNTSISTINSKIKALTSQRAAEAAKPTMVVKELASLKEQADLLCTKGL